MSCQTQIWKSLLQVFAANSSILKPCKLISLKASVIFEIFLILLKGNTALLKAGLSKTSVYWNLFICYEERLSFPVLWVLFKHNGNTQPQNLGCFPSVSVCFCVSLCMKKMLSFLQPQLWHTRWTSSPNWGRGLAAFRIQYSGMDHSLIHSESYQHLKGNDLLVTNHEE